MPIRLERARNLYLRGIRDGDVSVVGEYTGDVYIQHSAGVADGVEGFTQFFEEFLSCNPDREIELVRSFEDENGVFVHAHQILDRGGVQWVTMDWFRFDDDDKIVEHWDVIAPHVARYPSGRSSVDGPTEVVDAGQGPANAELVTAALGNLFMAEGDREAGLGDRPYARGDLFRIESGMIVEHWDVAEAIAPKAEWANTGEFWLDA